jgi:beta-galactosidase
VRWPLGLDALGFGGDYNPEQWPDEVRVEDVALMREAGVNLVSLAIFSWATIEPAEGAFDWEWLDTAMDRLHAGGIRVDLATATASPPPWLTAKHPEILPVRADGTVLWPGGRQHYRIASPVWRRYAIAMARRVAERYADHPALAMWHVDNEIGCHVPHDYSDDAAEGFRRWLRARYGTVERLNEAWGTAFWSQRYSEFEQVLPPRSAPTYPNPTQQLDLARYSSDELLSYYTDLRDALREVTPQVPVTTNFMVMGPSTGPMDYATWAGEMDVVSNDHYVQSDDPRPQADIAFSADLVRSLAGGAPWVLMEHSTSAVNWQPRNRTRTPDESLRHSLGHLAHGADALLFFQWRQSAAGAEKFHSAMLPHAGTDSERWRTTVRLGNLLEDIAEVRGSRTHAKAGVLFDWPSTWAAQLDSHPTQALEVRRLAVALHHALARRAVEADVVPATADLSRYDLILVPALYLATEQAAANVAAAAERGASVLVTFFSGIADEDDHIHLGGYPGAFRHLLGVRTEEFWALQAGERVALDDGSAGVLWSEKVHAAPGTQVVRTFEGGPLDGVPALTRRAVGAGAAWYLATWPADDEGVQRVVDALVDESGVPLVVPHLPDGVEVTRRHGGDGRSWLFVLNHTDAPVAVAATGTALLGGGTAAGSVTIPAGGVEVIRESS